MRASRTRTAVYAVIAVLIGVAAALGALEVLMRFLPVREPMDTQPVNAVQRYIHFRPNNELVYSAGWNFAIVNKVRINNFGFVNDQDYDPAATTSLIAVIGDSYVEATQVPYGDTLHGRLAAYVGDRGRVYSFGSSGSQLSQYLAYAELARDRFRPSALVVAIIGNDFDESHYEYKREPGFHYLKLDAQGQYTLEVVPFTPSLLHRTLRRSALVRHVHGNGFVSAAKRRIAALAFGEAAVYVGNVDTWADPVRVQKSEEAVEYFLETLPRYSGVDRSRIVFVVDGMRPQLYDAAKLREAGTSYFAHMREYFIRRARERGYLVADLQPRFIARHLSDGTRFEWAIDAHWNGLGHGEAAAAVIETGLPDKLFGAPPTP